MANGAAADRVQLARTSLPRLGRQNAQMRTTPIGNALVWRAEAKPDAETAGQLH